MTVDEMIAALQAAKERGLPGETVVVVATQDWYYIAASADDPSNHPDGEGPDMWFTLELGESADSRFTPGGMPG